MEWLKAVRKTDLLWVDRSNSSTAKWGQHHPPKLPRVKVVPAVPPPFGARMVSCYGLQKLLPQWQQCVQMGCQTSTR
jgi:hypothetical protein